MPRKTKMNSITSPELLSKVNPHNLELIDDFAEYLESTNRSKSTIKTYTSDLKICFVWSLLYNDNKFYVDWSKRNIVRFQNWLINENGNSPARVRRLRSSLSSLGNYIENVLDDEYPNYRNIINKIQAPPLEPVREKTVLSDEDVQSILDKFVSKDKIEAACYIALAAYGGRRKAEICRFRVSDFSDEHLVCGGSLWKSSPIKTKGRGNGKFISCYTLVRKFKPYFDMWMNKRKELGIKSEWLFPDTEITNEDVPIGIAKVNSWMNSASKYIGKDIYAHAFRHYFTTMLSNEGIPDGVIKDIIQWKDISMVSVYVDRDNDDTIAMYFDEGGIKKDMVANRNKWLKMSIA